MTETLHLTPALIKEWKEIVMQPDRHGYEGLITFNKVFKKNNAIVSQPSLYEAYVKYSKIPIPKAVFFTILKDVYFANKSNSGNIGFSLKLDPNIITKLEDGYISTIDKVKIGDYFRMRNMKTVYVKDRFNQSTKKHGYHRFDDINAYAEKKTGTEVEVGFTF